MRRHWFYGYKRKKGFDMNLAQWCRATHVPFYFAAQSFVGQGDGISLINGKRKRRMGLNKTAAATDYFIEKDGRIHIPQLDFVLTSRCNLNCKLCCQLNQLRNYDGDSARQLLGDLKRWAERLHIKALHLVGGEPLLRPDLLDIIVQTRAVLPDTTLKLWTNGTLIKTADKLWAVCKEHQVTVIISDHLDKPVNADILDRYGICYERRDQRQLFRFYHFDGSIPIYPDSDPQKAWSARESSCDRRHCTTFYRNRLFQCSHHAHRVMAQDEGILPKAGWENVTQLPAPTWESSANEIVDYLRRVAPPECAGCPEQQPVESCGCA